MQTSTFAVITGGGTSGHVLPALAIADALVAHGHRQDEIVYVGARSADRDTLGPAHGLCPPLHRCHRPPTTIDAAEPPTTVQNAVGDSGSARRIPVERRPAVVISVGGYASFPATAAARLRRIPVIVVSYDRTPGMASKLSARFAAASAVAFEGSTLPRARYTGAPVRAALIELDRQADAGGGSP